MLMATADQNDQKVIRRCGHSPVGFGLTFCRKEREFSTSETCIYIRKYCDFGQLISINKSMIPIEKTVTLIKAFYFAALSIVQTSWDYDSMPMRRLVH